MEVKITILSVCSDERTIQLFNNLMENLGKKLKKSPFFYIEIYHYIIVQNAYQLEEKIISTDLNTTNIILILGPASMKNDIIKAINKVEDKELTIGKAFATIPLFLEPSYIQFLNCTCRNNILIFSTIGSESEILKIIGRKANAMVLGAYVLWHVIKEYFQEPDERNILNRSQEEPQEEGESTQQSRSSSFLELPDSIKDENVSDKTYQETCQPKVSVADALSLIKQTVTKDHIFPLESEFVDIKNAFRRISSQAVTSRIDMPPFLVATKKGYTVRVEKEVKADESSEISPIVLDPDTSVLVEKGERIPLDATAVIPEKNVVSSSDEARIYSTHTIKYGQNVMFPGSDIKKGEIIVDKFTRIFSREIMFLTACGCENVKVFKKLSIGVMTIGNKLLEFEQPFEQGHLYDCNRLILISLLKEKNFDFDSLDLGITTKDPTLIKQKITANLETIDLLVTTGCSSDKDCLKNILKRDFEAKFLFENVDMKPGKSTAFALCNFKGKPKIILCLPGNPASVFVTAYVFFLPLVNWIHFNFKEDWPIINVEVDQELLLHHRPRYVWAILSWEEAGSMPIIICQEEHSITINNNLSESNGNALLILPPKTLQESTLEISSQVPALLVKFPIFHYN